MGLRRPLEGIWGLFTFNIWAVCNRGLTLPQDSPSARKFQRIRLHVQLPGRQPNCTAAQQHRSSKHSSTDQANLYIVHCLWPSVFLNNVNHLSNAPLCFTLPAPGVRFRDYGLSLRGCLDTFVNPTLNDRNGSPLVTSPRKLATNWGIRSTYPRN